MSNLEKWIKAILNEDADNLSIGSVRTLQMIKHEIERLQKEQDERKFTLQEILDCYNELIDERNDLVRMKHGNLKGYNECIRDLGIILKDKFNIDIKQNNKPI